MHPKARNVGLMNPSVALMEGGRYLKARPQVETGQREHPFLSSPLTGQNHSGESLWPEPARLYRQG